MTSVKTTMSKPMKPLVKVSSRKHFMDTLARMNEPPKSTLQEGAELRGRMTELKTYILETNKLFQKSHGEKVSWEIDSTGVDTIKIIHVHDHRIKNSDYEFYLDITDKRFSLLHTNRLASEANNIVRMIVNDHVHKVDHTWFYSDMMKRWIDKIGNFRGYTISHQFVNHEGIKIAIAGGDRVKIIRQILDNCEEIDEFMSHSAIDVCKGLKKRPFTDYVDERIDNTGHFAIKNGKSIEHHLDIVDECKEDYANKITHIEKQRLGVNVKGTTKQLVGNPIVILFKKPIERIETFMNNIFNAKEPYKLWGTISKNQDNYYNVAAVDMHEGSPINFEITPDMMRIYLHKNSCGNTLLRLFTNLQCYHNTGVTCDELN